jgi:ssDNA-binding Zn-finger/Zn-ribbon topoisomerase 1
MVYYIYSKPFFMLITKELEIRIAGNVGQYYKKNNIDVKFNQINKLPIEIVNPESHLIVDAECDVCGKQVKIQYRRYNQSISRGGYYTCSSKCASQKIKDTFKLNYGVETLFREEQFKEKSRETMIKKWGTPHFRQSEEWKIKNGEIEKEKRKDTIFNDFLNKNPNVVGQDGNNFIIRCDIHGDISIPKRIFSNRKVIKTELCVKCNPIEKNVSGKEIILYKLIQEIYNGEIIQSYKVERKEIDIYLPKLKIGFEFNGLRWHSELFKDDDYHIKKTILCQKNGIRLVHVFEDDFDNKREIIKSIIINLINNSEKIYARKTQLKVIEDSKILKDFLNENHLQGFVNSNINYGLYHNDELISVMTFMKIRKVFGGKNGGEDYELIRFCNKLGLSVVGGASKLLKRFSNDYSPKSIVSYCDISWANGNLYKKLRFTYDGLTPPNYHYVIDNVRVNRIKFQKHKLVKEGFNPKLTERKIMNERGYYRIYNCGNERYIKI